MVFTAVRFYCIPGPKCVCVYTQKSNGVRKYITACAFFHGRDPEMRGHLLGGAEFD